MAIKLSISGIRGKFHELTPNRVVNYTQAFATYLGGGDIVMGADLRPSGKFISEAVVAGLNSCGANVIDYGTLPTPILQWLIRKYRFNGGVSITAGHNSFDWNSLIFLNAEGSYLAHLEGEEFFNLYHSGKFDKKGFANQGTYVKGDHPDAGIYYHYLTDYYESLRTGDQAGRKLKLVVDCSNGFHSSIIDVLSHALAVKLIPVFCGESAVLQKDPVPNALNAEFLATIVRETGSDGGFLLNSDASRVLVVDERGKPFSEELTLPIFAMMVLEDEPSDIVTNYSTSRVVDEVAKKFRAKVFRTDVGQPYVVQMVKEIKTVIGGEGSGSVVYSPFSYGFDSFVFIKKIVEYLRKHNLEISAIGEELKTPQIYKETIYLKPSKIYAFLEKVGDSYKEKMKLKDGFYIDRGDAWLCIRVSSTVSMIRLIGEGKGIRDEIRHIKEQVA